MKITQINCADSEQETAFTHREYQSAVFTRAYVDQLLERIYKKIVIRDAVDDKLMIAALHRLYGKEEGTRTFNFVCHIVRNRDYRRRMFNQVQMAKHYRGRII